MVTNVSNAPLIGSRLCLPVCTHAVFILFSPTKKIKKSLISTAICDTDSMNVASEAQQGGPGKKNKAENMHCRREDAFLCAVRMLGMSVVTQSDAPANSL